MAIPNHPPATADIAALKARAKRMRHHMLVHGARPRPGLHRPGPRHRRRARRALLPRAALVARPTSTIRSATASCCRPGTTRSRSGRRSPRPASSRSTSSPPTAPTTAGSRCRRSTPRPASRSSAARSATASARASAWRSACGSTAPTPASSASSPTAKCRRARPGRRRWPAATSASTTSSRWSTATASRPTAPIVIDIEPVADKWRAFGWDTQEIDGNDMAAVVAALAAARGTRRQAARDRAAHAARQGRADAREAREGAFRPRRRRTSGTR